MSRITPIIKFNLKDRGRQHTGQDRSNVDIRAWVDLINSPSCQEMIETGGLYGYYGHQVRMLFGMNPPETAYLNGKEYRIIPALRTLHFKADYNGDVEHRVEFLETDPGETAYRNYKGKIGGFSMAVDGKTNNGLTVPTAMGGMDYVLQQNYLFNRGNGLFDSALPQTVRDALEMSLAELYDSISRNIVSEALFDDATEKYLVASQLEQKFLEEQAKEAKRKRLQQERQTQLNDSALCPTVSFDEFEAEIKLFDSMEVEKSDAEKSTKTKVAKKVGGLFNFF